jgi:predicted permease
MPFIDVRDIGWEAVVDSLWRDSRYAVRGLRASPGFTAIAVLTLALGIGANTAIFSVVNSLWLRTLPVAEPQRLVTVSSARMLDQGFGATWSYGIWDQIRQRAGSFDGALAWSSGGATRLNLSQSGETEPADGLFVSGDFFTTLGVPLILGRTFTTADDLQGSPPVAVISYGLWQRRFGGAGDVIGRSLLVNRTALTIVGVTPPGFFGAEVGRSFDVAVPIGAEPLIRGKDRSWLNPMGPTFLTVMLRLKPGQSLDAATAALRGVQAQIYDASLPSFGLNLSSPDREEFLRDPFRLVPAGAGTSMLRLQYQRPLLTILAVVSLVLLIACANIANLMLARAAVRRHEMSVRLALGGPRWRVARQLLIESLVLSGIGTVAGLLLAAWGSRALVAQLSTSVDRVFLDVSLDWRVLAFTAALTIATAVLFGIAPAFRASHAEPMDALKEPASALRASAGLRRGFGPGGRMSVSAALVVAQVALALMLVVAAGLFIRTYQRLANVPLGFDSGRVLVVNVDTERAHVAPSGRFRLYQQLVDAAGAVPGVARAAGSQMTPVNAGLTMVSIIDVTGVTPERGRVVTAATDGVATNFITPVWLAVYGSTLRAGRDIDDRDTTTGPRVTLVNEAFVRRYFPGGNAIGQTIRPLLALPGEMPQAKTIVGVVGDAVFRSLRDDVPPTMYQPLSQWDWGPAPAEISISIRAATGSPMLLARSVGAALSAANRDLAFSFRPLTDQIDADLAQERVVAMLSGLFGGLALLLAAVGLGGITAYAVARRRSEIGIRMALGAQPSDVVRLVIGRTLVMTAVGMAVGLASAAAVSRSVASMLFGITPLDPSTFIVVSVLFAAVATVAAWIPARRATRVDPMIALRCE